MDLSTCNGETYLDTLPLDILLMISKKMTIDNVINTQIATTRDELTRLYPKKTIKICEDYNYINESQEYKDIFDEMLLKKQINFNMCKHSLIDIVRKMMNIDKKHWKYMYNCSVLPNKRQLSVHFPFIESCFTENRSPTNDEVNRIRDFILTYNNNIIRMIMTSYSHIPNPNPVLNAHIKQLLELHNLDSINLINDSYLNHILNMLMRNLPFVNLN